MPIHRRAALLLVIAGRVVARESVGRNKWTIPVPFSDLSSVDLLGAIMGNPDESVVDQEINRRTKRKQTVNQLEFMSGKQRNGRLTIDMQGNAFGKSTSFDYVDEKSSLLRESTTEASVSVDLAATARLIRIALATSGAFISAFMGTLRLLAPLIVARRSLNTVGDLVYDYSMGRYLRTTYTRMEHLYVRFFELPAAFRALSRTAAQLCILFVLSNLMEWMVGLSRTPCRNTNGSCSWWCSMLWMGAVIGTGHAASSAVAVWGGPLRIQVAASHFSTTKRRSVVARVFTRPWHIFQWMQDPEAWVSMMATPSLPRSEPFEPIPMLFPATWLPLRLLQLLAVTLAIESTVEISTARGLMKRCLIQTALTDEWHRVFINERRVALGSCIGLLYFISQLVVTISVATVFPTAAILMVPVFLAIVVSVWMNLVIFWNRLEKRRQDAAIQAFEQSREAALRAIKWP